SFGLDRPLVVQYVHWLGAAVQGDFGVSFARQRPVRDVLAEAVPRTLQLTVLALVVHYTVGTALGVWLAMRRGRWAPRCADLVALVLYSLPAFWLGLVLQLWWSYAWRWLPSGGTPTGTIEELGALAWTIEQARHLAMPV